MPHARIAPCSASHLPPQRHGLEYCVALLCILSQGLPDTPQIDHRGCLGRQRQCSAASPDPTVVCLSADENLLRRSGCATPAMWTSVTTRPSNHGGPSLSVDRDCRQHPAHCAVAGRCSDRHALQIVFIIRLRCETAVGEATLRTLGIACCSWHSMRSRSRSFTMVSVPCALCPRTATSLNS